ncbi:hypothetical protein EIN_093600 [Entamoeba invadens IP1]|uniref:Nucleoplasmin-like domain-containing protein n=1 Tax=Entamoeba invadens IP1 TaxID=370355 RepID=A0A0A1U384_ENTIV|nr:hypothetical protein EIN_093600 [Entamoeba invadens IP1]ELP87203.1 hypothetical protein EIN_093600 [Entamoeba invadens IP1]|eukprot:XP_004253974.1 hypothetical protein EIN_093600 [Entamoeba invadens IP1]
MATLHFEVNTKPVDIPNEGEITIHHLALEGKETTKLFLQTKDEEGEKDVKILLATLSEQIPQHSLEIPIYGEDAKLYCEGKGTVYVLATQYADDGMEGLEEDDSSEEENQNGEFVPAKKMEEEKPKEEKKAEKKVEKKEEKKAEKKEEKKEEKKPVPKEEKKVEKKEEKKPVKKEEKKEDKKVEKKEDKKQNKKQNKKHNKH